MKKVHIYTLHIVYWLLYVLLINIIFLFLNLTLPVLDIGLWSRSVFGFAVIPGVLSFYGCYVFLFDRFGRPNAGFIGSATTFILSVASIGALTGQMLVGKTFMFNDGYNSFLAVAALLVLIATVNGAVGLMLKGFITWYNDIELNALLRQKQHEHELALIKLQLDPHFLLIRSITSMS